MSSDLQFHEAANIFPLMAGDDFDGLVADIKEHGLREEVTLLDGKVIDGRNRYRACLLAGVHCRTVAIQIDDPVAYVLSLNLQRRHLTASQKSLVAAKATTLKEKLEEEALKRMKAGKKSDPMVTLPQGTTRDQMGKAVGVSGSMVDRATKVSEKGTPELVKAVEEGRMSVTTAAQLADEPADVQVAAAAEAKVSGGRYRNPKAKQGDADTAPIDNYPKTARFALEAARCAITQLKPIPRSNPGREEAFSMVEKWIQSQRKKA